MQKRFLTLLVTFVMCAFIGAPAWAAGTGMAAAEQLDSAEKVLYGAVQKGSLAARTDSMETDVYGLTTNYDVLYRIDRLHKYVLDTVPVKDGKANTFLLQLNGVDSRINAIQSVGPAKSRLETLEKSLYGKNYSGSPLMSRLDKLIATTYKADKVSARYVTLPANVVFEIVFPKAVLNKDVKAGEPVTIRTADNLYVNDVLVLPRGTAGSALVMANNGSALEKFLGRNKKLALICPVLYAADGREVPVNLGEYARQQTKATPGSSSLGGMLFTGLPAEKSADTDVLIPAGARTFVQVTKDTGINGIVYVPAGK
jgi:hypothetical protein